MVAAMRPVRLEAVAGFRCRISFRAECRRKVSDKARQGSSPFLKKRTKKLLLFTLRSACVRGLGHPGGWDEGATAESNVFCFFFSKKKAFLTCFQQRVESALILPDQRNADRNDAGAILRRDAHEIFWRGDELGAEAGGVCVEGGEFGGAEAVVVREGAGGGQVQAGEHVEELGRAGDAGEG